MLTASTTPVATVRTSNSAGSGPCRGGSNHWVAPRRTHAPSLGLQTGLANSYLCAHGLLASAFNLLDRRNRRALAAQRFAGMATAALWRPLIWVGGAGYSSSSRSGRPSLSHRVWRRPVAVSRRRGHPRTRPPGAGGRSRRSDGGRLAADDHGALGDLEHVVDGVVTDELVEDALEYLTARHPPQAQGPRVAGRGAGRHQFDALGQSAEVGSLEHLLPPAAVPDGVNDSEVHGCLPGSRMAVERGTGCSWNRSVDRALWLWCAGLVTGPHREPAVFGVDVSAHRPARHAELRIDRYRRESLLTSADPVDDRSPQEPRQGPSPRGTVVYGEPHTLAAQHVDGGDVDGRMSRNPASCMAGMLGPRGRSPAGLHFAKIPPTKGSW